VNAAVIVKQQTLFYRLCPVNTGTVQLYPSAFNSTATGFRTPV